MRFAYTQERDRASRYLLYALFALLPLTVVFGHRGVAPWLLLASIPAFLRGDFWQSAFGELFDRPSFARPFFAGAMAIFFFGFWIFLSGLWSPKHHYSLFLYVLAPVLVGGSVIWFSLNLPRLWTYRLAMAFSLAIAGGMAVLVFEGVTDGLLRSILPPNDPAANPARDIIALGRGVSALAAALFPAAIIISMIWNRLWALGVLGLGVIAALTNDVSANAIAIAAGLTAAAIAFRAPKTTINVAVWAVIGLIVFTPFAAALIPVDAIYAWASAHLAPADQAQFASWLHRLAIWKSVAGRAFEGLPFGFGADYARIWSETAPLISVPGAPAGMSLMPTHPHNVFLQIWLELGLPGVFAFALSVYFAGEALRGRNLPKPVIAALIGAIAATSVSFSVEGSMWQVWRLAAVALAGMGVALSYSLHAHWRS